MLRVNIVGIGPGNPELLTESAHQAIEESNILIGDKRMLKLFVAEGKSIHYTIKFADIMDIVTAANPEKDELAVLVSGDIGFFSLAKILTNKLTDCECMHYCGISSLVYFAAKLKMPWDDVKLVSMHGRNQNLVSAVAQNRKVFCLTGGDNSPQALCAKLCSYDMGHVKVYVGENLSYPEEKITVGTAAEISKGNYPSLSVMMILNEAANNFEQSVHGLDDEMFVRGKAPMTKQEVRSVAISKLRPKVADCIFDIGAGTGSCSVELALIAKQGNVLAFEKNAEALQLLKENKERFGLDNIEIVAGDAMENIRDKSAPDCVFIGGSGGTICKMLDIIYAKNLACRIVITAITLETLAEVTAYYKDNSSYNLEIVNISAARSRKHGRYNLMMAQNPVYIMTAVKKED